MTDKQGIFTAVVDKLGVPRPTVRRVARDLLESLIKKTDILKEKQKRNVLKKIKTSVHIPTDYSGEDVITWWNL